MKRGKIYFNPTMRVFAIIFFVLGVSITAIVLMHQLLELDLIVSSVAALAIGMAAGIYPVRRLTHRENQPRDTIKQRLRLLGEGQINPPMRLNRLDVMYDIAESINRAERELSEKLKSIARNAGRISAVERQLAERFRPREAGDKYVKNLVYMLEISTNRLQNDLESFIIKEEPIDIRPTARAAE